MTKPKTTAIPVYEVRLVPSRRPLRLAEAEAPHSAAAARVLHELIGTTDREHLACLFLDGSHRITGVHIAAIGGQSVIQSIDHRGIFRAALAACAQALVVSHNHPSGDPTPSPQDKQFTRHLVAVGQVVGIPVVDHVIVTRDPRRYHSMQLAGTMPASV